MTKPHPTLLFIIIITLLTLPTTQRCTLCQQCTHCSPDVLEDSYIDDILHMLLNRMENIGRPLAITRTPKPTSIIYDVEYSSGLVMSMALDLKTFQVELLNYSIQSNKTSSTTTTTNKETESAKLSSTITTVV